MRVVGGRAEPMQPLYCSGLTFPFIFLFVLVFFLHSDTEGMGKQLGQEVMSKDTDLAFIDL